VRRHLLRSLIRNREFLEKASLAQVLPFVAGLVNAEGFVIVGVYTSHVTGTVARAGDEFSRGHHAIGLYWLGLVAAFFAGAFTATALVLRGGRSLRGRYSLALGAETLTLLAVTLLGVLRPTNAAFVQFVTTLLLCFAMGAQNALVTKLSGAVVRTTHLTGIVTDLGIEAVRAITWYRSSNRHRALREVARDVVHMRQHPQLKRMRLHIAIFASFLAGAIVGPILYAREGYTAMLLPVGVLTGLMIFDVAIGLGPANPDGTDGVSKGPATPGEPGAPQAEQSS
jgi:uncharacterized membrane protein YoaK (UPF0700 family)